MLVIFFALMIIVGIALFITSPIRTDTGAKPGRPAGAVLAVVGLVGALSQSIISIPAGHVGLKDFFGKVSDTTLPAGIHLVNPLLNIREMDVRTQEITESATVPSKEGLNLRLDVSILYRLEAENAAGVYKTIGMNFANVFIITQLRAKVRGATTAYEAKALYTSQRKVLADGIFAELHPIFEERGIRLEQVLLRSVTLPNLLAQAIEEKLQAEQEAERMQFILQREEQEAQRKKIEAQGISDFQQIVSASINDNLLRWKGIEATEKLASSPNAKVVVVGGKDGLPLILNPDK
jgi:regulator of protease activity HflC (stomatin/prohibitin superfamily)